MPIEDDTWPLVTIHDLALAFPGKLVSPEDTSGLEADQDDPDEVEPAQFREIPEPTGEAELKLEIYMGGLNAAQLAALERQHAANAGVDNRDRQADADVRSAGTAEATPNHPGPGKPVGETVGAATSAKADAPDPAGPDKPSAGRANYTLDAIPKLDDPGVEWMSQDDAEAYTGYKVGTLKNNRSSGTHGDGRCSGIDTGRRAWRKHRVRDHDVYYVKSTLFKKKKS